MSAASSWSYTAKATVWPRNARADWSGVSSYGAPEVFDCDYTAESQRMTDAKGIEFTTRQIVFTEREDIKQGDMLLIGESVLADPKAAGAFEVRLVGRFADTFDRLHDDYRVVT